MRDVTLLFLVKKEARKITDICLGMKKIGFGQGRWNGAGGKVEDGEGIQQAAHRETEEELGVIVTDSQKVAELTFYFPEHKKEYNQLAHVYVATEWEGEITESEELLPQWFKIENIPYNTMWSDDMYWLPDVLDNKFVTAEFTFDEDDGLIDKRILSRDI